MATEMEKFEPTLTNCDKEPLHHIGSIQDCGFLIALAPSNTIEYVSCNISKFLGFQPDEVLGRSILEFFPEFPQGLWASLAPFPALNSRDFLCKAQKKNGEQHLFHANCHNGNDVLIVEFEVESIDLNEASIFMDRLNEILDQFGAISGRDSVLTVLNLVADIQRSIVGFDRVMVYEFDEVFNGTVIVAFLPFFVFLSLDFFLSFFPFFFFFHFWL
jgi:light-regulated signal transduction histidine kinase (bacteriophytochrome)